MIMPHYQDICPPPAVTWCNVHTLYLLHIVKEGVHGSWAECPNQLFSGLVLTCVFFLVWPFLVGTVNDLPEKRWESI